MDPPNQSGLISSSQGVADGQNSAARESKLSDSFLSSSPVSLIQSPQDKRVVLGLDHPSEGIATSLRFPSQSGSFSPGRYGSEAGLPEGQPDSPIKMSPVSERIKALEALAAKEKVTNFRSDGGFSHFRDRRSEKSPTEKVPQTFQKKGASAEQESPESPFEVLGDFKQLNEMEETEEWMKAHVPPVPNLKADLGKGVPPSEDVSSKEVKEAEIVVPAAPVCFVGIPDPFMDSVEVANVKELSNPLQQPSVDEESEFDLRFLPTAYMWDHQEKTGAKTASVHESILPATPAPPVELGSESPPCSPPPFDTNAKPSDLDMKETTWPEDLEPPEVTEVDSSGDSDDTVIEDGIPSSVDPPAFAPTDSIYATMTNAPSVSNDEKKTPPAKSERKLMQVPTINVIETDEPNYSDDEMELQAEDDDYEVVNNQDKESSKTPQPEPDNMTTQPPKSHPLETEFMEGYSPPSSPVGSDVEYSPKRKLPKADPEAEEEVLLKNDDLSNTGAPEDDSRANLSQEQPKETQVTSSRSRDESPPFTVTNEDVLFPDNGDEWSDEVRDITGLPCKTDLGSKDTAPDTQTNVDENLYMADKEAHFETVSLCKSPFLQDDVYDRQSFDYDYDEDTSPNLDGDEGKELSGAQEGILPDSSQISFSSKNIAHDETQNLDDEKTFELSSREYPQDPYSSFQGELLNSTEEPILSKTRNDTENSEPPTEQKAVPDIEQDGKTGHSVPEATDNPETIEPDVSESRPIDSFVEFMQECLKSRLVDDPDNVASKEVFKTESPPPQSPPTTVMDLEQEQLTISALKELGSSEEEDEGLVLHPEVSGQDDFGPDTASANHSSHAPVPNPSSLQTGLAFDSMCSKEVDAINDWVAEVYRLAEHVLTAVLTHVSVKDLIHWRDPKKSGLVFGLSMLMLLSLAAFSIISVVSYLLLALLCVTITFRIYKSVVQAVQKSNEGHPFKALIDKDVSVAPETFHKHVDASLTHINRALKHLSRLFLVEDLVDSLKLAVVLWLFTYVGAVFNGITILILADILLFAVPPIYEKNKTQIDHYINLVRTQVNNTVAKLQEKLPGAVKRSKTE
ncbi:reticulon-3 isoform X1 [Thalassophryne amazonica]|uniref:reticulon-3 isoform X1 n=1 Tax=Thalassophryne amazonica TaxID=390379 RepID=UPI0014715138|nr:reticulon-3 isoform X1 [Thalassophryne amazonica]